MRCCILSVSRLLLTQSSKLRGTGLCKPLCTLLSWWQRASHLCFTLPSGFYFILKILWVSFWEVTSFGWWKALVLLSSWAAKVCTALSFASVVFPDRLSNQLSASFSLPQQVVYPWVSWGRLLSALPNVWGISPNSGLKEYGALSFSLGTVKKSPF